MLLCAASTAVLHVLLLLVVTECTVKPEHGTTLDDCEMADMPPLQKLRHPICCLLPARADIIICRTDTHLQRISSRR